MTCGNCALATTKSPAGGISVYRNAMAAQGFTGCKLDRSEATVYSIGYSCDKFSQASAEQMEKRRVA